MNLRKSNFYDNPASISFDAGARSDTTVPAAQRIRWKKIRILCMLILLVAGIGFIRSTLSCGPANPLRIPLQLAANFGELRSGHFHMGVDIRTNGQENLPVYATAAGYVSQVIVEPYGYGKALLITHPNGLTTLYAHLNRFYEPLEQFVTGIQYAKKSWQQDTSLAPGKFPIEKGQLIAYSGNTGQSEGPHLHFELRNSRTGNNLNPALHGFAQEDDTPPRILGLYWYDRRYSTYENGATRIDITGEKGHYRTKRKIVKVTSPVISFGIRAEDRVDGSRFRFGIYSARILVDDQLVNKFTFNNFSNTASRYINACVDYLFYIRTGLFIQHLSILPGNKLKIFEGGNGIIHLKDNRPHEVHIRVEDVSGNVSDLHFTLQLGQYDPVKHTAGVKRLVPGRTTKVTGRYTEVSFSKNAWYDTVPFVLREQPGYGPDRASARVTLHKSTVPVHSAYTVRLKTSLHAKDPLKKRTVMLFTGIKNKYTVRGRWENDRLCASFDELGSIQLIIDTVNPELSPSGWKNNEVFGPKEKSLSLLCHDDKGGIAGFWAELNGEWILVRQKGNLYTYTFDGHCPPGKHRLTVRVTDIAGNATVRDFTFVKQ